MTKPERFERRIMDPSVFEPETTLPFALNVEMGAAVSLRPGSVCWWSGTVSVGGVTVYRSTPRAVAGFVERDLIVDQIGRDTAREFGEALRRVLSEPMPSALTDEG